VKVAKKEKQLFATQYSYDKEKNKLYYYPVDQPETLNERRKKAGLDPLDISTLEFVSY